MRLTDLKTDNFKRYFERTGERHGRLLVVKRAQNVGTHAAWECICDCGNKKIVTGSNLLHTSSCGCLKAEIIAAENKRRNTIHGLSHTPEYVAYSDAKRRCTVPSVVGFQNYGGRGIEFRFQSFEEFLAEVGMKPTAKHTLDRIRVNGHYEHGNIRWATRLEQRLNTRIRTIEHPLGLRGVRRHGNKWRAVIAKAGKRLDLGLFTSKHEAARAYDAAAVELHGNLAVLNFPRGEAQ